MHLMMDPAIWNMLCGSDKIELCWLIICCFRYFWNTTCDTNIGIACTLLVSLFLNKTNINLTYRSAAI
jgi:hypothetical protein